MGTDAPWWYSPPDASLREEAVEGERVQRRLAAILAADVVGYSHLTGADEEGTIARLRALRSELIDPTIAAHGGRIVKTTGDGILIEFASVVDAVRCAVKVQRGMTTRNTDVPAHQRIEFRIGVHIGDVVVDGDDLLGDGVNVAARLEGLADTGGICLSRAAHEQLHGKLDLATEDLGEQRLKNVAQPVRAFRVLIDKGSQRSASTLPLPDKPSIAVLPFQNMSGDPEQEYFADGMVEDIITALSRFRQLFVIARNSSFTYKGRAVDVKQVGRELGVRYVLEGSVRKAGNKVRITGQLIDSSTNTHLWGDRFDGSLEDIFDLQDQVTVSVVGAIMPRLGQAEIERAKRKPTESLDAYDCYLRGMGHSYPKTSEENSEALRLFYRAIELDPEFAASYGRAAQCYVFRKMNGWMVDGAREMAEAERLARQAAELGKDDAYSLSYAGLTLAYTAGDVEGGDALLARARVLNPNLAVALQSSAWVKGWIGEPEAAVEHAEQAMRLSPLDPFQYSALTALGYGHLYAGRYDVAVACVERALLEVPVYPPALRLAAMSYALAGRLDEAHKAVARLCQVAPTLRLSTMKDFIPCRRPEDRERYMGGLRKAGLPE
jgi:TolB-like protein/Flp pilus assembly protein TadD